MQRFYSATTITPYLQALYGRRHFSDVKRYEGILVEFQRRFGYDYAYFCSSSGRVELIGNHTDHNGGSVLACAINLDIVAAFRPNGKDTVTIYGRDRNAIRIDINDLSKSLGSAGLVKGVLHYLKTHGYAIGGFDAYTDSTVPSGAGVSSSAAFEILIATIVSASFNDGNIPVETLASAGQYAENEYFNKPCGLLDQSVVAVGGLVRLDFVSGLNVKPLDVNSKQFQLVLVDTGASHSGLSHLYAEIPAEMKAVAAYFGKSRLINLDEKAYFDQFDELSSVLGQRPVLRAKHFFEDNRRVSLAEKALLSGDVDNLIELINASGDSSLYQLQNCSTSESDTAISDAIKLARSICPCGARVHGGGFAGTALCVVPSRYAAQLVAELSKVYGDNKVYPLNLRSLGAVVI